MWGFLAYSIILLYIPGSIEVVCNAEKVGEFELKDGGVLSYDLVDTVQELEEDGRPVVGMVRVTKAVLKLVTK